MRGELLARPRRHLDQRPGVGSISPSSMAPMRCRGDANDLASDIRPTMVAEDGPTAGEGRLGSIPRWLVELVELVEVGVVVDIMLAVEK